MKRVLALAILIAGCFVAPALAQTPAPQPSPPAHHMRIMQLFSGLDGITQAQLQQIQGLLEQYRAAHPPGGPDDPAARQTLMKAVMDVLTPAQQTQLRDEVMQFRAAHRAEAEPSASPQP
jgi:Spy/CpxP family protein refolding chaperone